MSVTQVVLATGEDPPSPKPGEHALSIHGRVEFVPPPAVETGSASPDEGRDPARTSPDEVLVRFRGSDGRLIGAKTWGEAQLECECTPPAEYLSPSFDVAPGGLRWVPRSALKLECSTDARGRQRSEKRPDVLEYEAKLACVELAGRGLSVQQTAEKLGRPSSFVEEWREARRPPSCRGVVRPATVQACHGTAPTTVM